jgi:Protein of unknown function (DUF1573)
MFCTRILLILLIAVAVSPFRVCAQDNAADKNKNTTGAVVNFINNDRIHDFGTMLVNGSDEYKFEFVNSGTEPLVIKEMHGTGKGLNMPAFKLLVSYPQGAIAPGQRSAITVMVKALNESGSFKSEVYITSNATGPKYRLLLIKGNIVSEPGNAAPKITDTAGAAQFNNPVVGNNAR